MNRFFKRLLKKFPIREFDANGNQTYYEYSDGFWVKYEYDVNCRLTYIENSNGYWVKYEFDASGNQTYLENSDGVVKGEKRL